MPVLPHVFQVQQTGYYCGPAAVKVALSCRGIHIAQGALASALGTTTAGTDSSVDVVRVMNANVGPLYGMRGAAVSLAPSTLAVELRRSIDAGYAVVANVVGTIHTQDGYAYPYPGGHYVALTGYDGPDDSVLVSDVAVREYWASTADVARWIVGRGYSYLAMSTVEDDDMPKLFRVNETGMYLVTSGSTWYHLGTPDLVAAAIRIWGFEERPLSLADLDACGTQVPAPATTSTGLVLPATVVISNP